MKITAIFCDAGSTNLLAHYLKCKKIKFDCYATGAALKILPKIFPKKKINKFINNDVAKNKILITTTSLNNEFEFKAKLLCRNKKIKIISVIDHWINYRARFKYNNKTYIPNEIWVFDKYAKNKCKKLFLKTKILQKKNYYLENVSKRIDYKKPKKSILYICERNRNINNLIKFEFLNLSKILIKFKNKFENGYKLIIKLHPSSKNKEDYKKIILKFKKIDYEILKDTSIEKALSQASIIVGIRSYAMYISTFNSLKTYTLLSKKDIYKYIPYKKVIIL